MFPKVHPRDHFSLGAVIASVVALTFAAALTLPPTALTAQGDTTSPTVSLTAPAANATVSGVVPVSAAASDNVGVAGVQFRLDGASLGAEDVTAPYAISWNTLGSPDLLIGVTKVIVAPMTMTAGSGMTKRLSVSCPGCGGEDMSSEDKLQTAAGPVAATWTFSTPAHYLSQVAAFKAAGTPAFVQGAVASSNTASTSIAGTFGASVVAGHLVVVMVAWTGTSAVTVTDTRGNAYAVATSAYDAVNGQTLAILYAANTASGATTVTASFGGTPTVRRLGIHEYAGIATTSPLDGTMTNIADGTTTANVITSGSATTTVGGAVTGTHTLTAQARDAAGNTAVSADVTVTVGGGGGPDTTPPVISGVAASAITTSGATINWTTNEASDSRVNYGLTTAYGTSSALNNSDVTSHQMALSGLAANTTYHYRVRSRDAANNLALSGDFTFVTLSGTDTMPPTVSISAPSGGSTLNGMVTVSGIASDNVGVMGVQFQLDGAILGNEDMATPYSMSWNTTTATIGSHILTAVARDAATNQTTSAAVTVTVANDTTPPVISGVAASAITSSGATINWTTDEASDSQVDYGLTTAYGSTSALNASLVTVHPVSLSGLTGGTLYHIRARSRDAAGNLALSSDVTFTTLSGTDVTAPVVSISAPVGGATVSGVVPVSAAASDNVGVAGVQFRLDGASLGAEDVTAPYAISWNTLGSNDLLIGVTKVVVGPMTMTAGSGMTKRLSLTCPGCGGEDMASEDKLQTAAGPVAASWTFSTPAHYLAQVAAFKAAGTPAFVQGAVAASNTASTSIAGTFGASVVAGHLVVVTVAWAGTSAVTVTDTRGNVYAVATSAYDAVNGQTLAILYAANTASGATTVTASFGGTAAVQRLGIHEYAGIATTSPLDGTMTNIADGTTTANAITSGSATTTVGGAVTGTHTLTALARDAAGNTAVSADVTVTVGGGGDTTPPVISGVASSAITTSGATINWTTNEASDSQVDYGLTTAYGSTSALNASLLTAHTVSLSGLTGSTLYHVRVRSRDAAGNLALSSDVTFTTLVAADTTPPVISGVAASAITSSGATINWTTNEASDSQVDYGLTTAYGSTSALNASLVTAHPVTLSGLTAGTVYHARARSRDAAGNLALSSDVTFTTLSGTDVTAPVVSISAPSGGATVFGALPVSAAASDNVGVAGVQFRLDGASLGAEDVTAPYAISWNTLGSPDLLIGVTKVIVAPMTMTAGSGMTKRLSVSCPGCGGEDMSSEDKLQTAAGPVAATWTFSTPAHYLSQVAAFKAAGTPAFVQGAVASSNTASTSIAGTFGASVVAGHLVVVMVAWTGTSAVSVTDTRGNAYAVATSAYDAVNGQTLAILYAANTASGATTVTASFGGTPTVRRLGIHEYAGVATTSPLDGTMTNIADGSTTANVITSGLATTTVTTGVTTGSHTLTALARDAAGNTATSAAVTVTVNNGDITPPVISGVAAASITSSGATINWTTNETSDSQVDYGLTTAYGSTSPLNGSLVTTHSVILGALAGNTTYHVRARSKDAAGNLALSADFAFATVAVDATLPVVSITAPAAGATVSGTTTFSATATDNVGVTGVEFKRDGVLIAPQDTAAPYSVAWNTTTASAGSHTLTAVAWDAAGNSATATRTVTVSNPLATVNLAWNANTESDLAGYKVYVGTSSGSYTTTYNVGNIVAYTVTGLAPGNVYYFVVTAYDQTAFESTVSNEVNATR